MTGAGAIAARGGPVPGHASTVARNVPKRWLAIAAGMVIAVCVLPIKVAPYRDRRALRALNGTLGTIFFLFTVYGCLACVTAVRLARYLERLRHLRPDQSPAADDRLCGRRPLDAIETRGRRSIEADFTEDSWRACRQVLPAIDAVDEQIGRLPPVVAVGRSRRTRYHV